MRRFQHASLRKILAVLSLLLFPTILLLCPSAAALVSTRTVRPLVVPPPRTGSSGATTQLYLFGRVWRKLRRGKSQQNDDNDKIMDKVVVNDDDDDDDDDAEEPVAVKAALPKVAAAARQASSPTEQADLVIIGGGVSGLTAAIAACNTTTTATTTFTTKANNKPNKIILLEAAARVGGRVQSDVTTTDGLLYTLDVGFAVFIQAYPVAQQVLDYDALELQPFAPGALIRLPNRNRLARVADPLRQPGALWSALTAPVGTFWDKVKFLPLLWHLRTTSIEELFEEPETSTDTALNERWGFSTAMQEQFFAPFLEGIYLTPLSQQSSRLFSLVLKMFAEGSAALPRRGMGAVAQQLADKATAAGTDIRTNQRVTRITQSYSPARLSPVYHIATPTTCIETTNLIIATQGPAAQDLIGQLDGFAFLADLPPQPQRSVGCVYYSFAGPPPVNEPILILNGCGGGGAAQQRNTAAFPINNICFPTTLQPSYAPAGYSLCSVTVLSQALEAYENDDAGLDQAVRQQLACWFRDNQVVSPDAILHDWKLQRIYRIPHAQPAHWGGPMPANVNTGRPCNVFRGKMLPSGVWVCGDHMATSTLNGALQSGRQAGQASGRALQRTGVLVKKGDATATTTTSS